MAGIRGVLLYRDVSLLSMSSEEFQFMEKVHVLCCSRNLLDSIFCFIQVGKLGIVLHGGYSVLFFC